MKGGGFASPCTSLQLHDFCNSLRAVLLLTNSRCIQQRVYIFTLAACFPIFSISLHICSDFRRRGVLMRIYIHSRLVGRSAENVANDDVRQCARYVSATAVTAMPPVVADAEYGWLSCGWHRRLTTAVRPRARGAARSRRHARPLLRELHLFVNGGGGLRLTTE